MFVVFDLDVVVASLSHFIDAVRIFENDTLKVIFEGEFPSGFKGMVLGYLYVFVGFDFG